jgi:hypothetical protein
MLAFGNNALQRGNPQEARRAFESAYGLSQHDYAFNEDARVQLHNLKLQQALVGLNIRQSNVAGEANAVAGKLTTERGGQEPNYTQQDAKQIIDQSSADEKAAFTRLAERLIEQQDAAASSPTVIRASVPQQGRLLTFSRSVAVDPWSDLRIRLEAKAAVAASWFTRIAILAAAALVFGFAGRYAKRFRPAKAAAAV